MVFLSATVCPNFCRLALSPTIRHSSIISSISTNISPRKLLRSECQVLSPSSRLRLFFVAPFSRRLLSLQYNHKPLENRTKFVSVATFQRRRKQFLPLIPSSQK